MLADPPLALVQQVAAKLVYVALQLDVAGFGVRPAGRFAGAFGAAQALGRKVATLVWIAAPSSVQAGRLHR